MSPEEPGEPAKKGGGTEEGYKMDFEGEADYKEEVG